MMGSQNYWALRFALMALAFIFHWNATLLPAQSCDDRLIEANAERIEKASRLYDIFSAQYEKQDYRVALETAKRVLAIREGVFGTDHVYTANILSDLASIYDELGDYSEAVKVYSRVVSIREKQLGVGHMDTVASWNNLAAAHFALGNLAKAKSLFVRTLAAEEKRLGRDHLEVAITLNNLGELETQQAKYGDALEHLRRALQIKKQHLGLEHASTATTVAAMGGVYQRQGNFEAAATFHLRAKNIFTTLQGGDTLEAIISASNLASVYVDQKEYEKAEPLMENALTVLLKQRGDDHPLTATARNNLASVYDCLGKYDQSQPLYLHTMKIRINRLGGEHPLTAATMGNLAYSYKKQGKYDEAKPLYLRARQANQKILGISHPATIPSLENLATLEVAMGHDAQAAELFHQARQATRRHVVMTLSSLSETEQMDFLERKYRAAFQAAVSFSLERLSDSHLVEQSAEWLINGKAITHETLANRTLIARSDASKPAADLIWIRERMASLALKIPDPNEATERRELIRDLTAREQVLARKLGRASLGQLEQSSWVGLPQVRQGLPEGSVLVDLLRIGRFDFAAVGVGNASKKAHYAAWVSHAGASGKTTLVDLGPADDIDELVAAVRKEINSVADANGTYQRFGEADATAALKQQLTRLSDRVWKPLETHLCDARNIVICPDAALWLVPWNALSVGDNRDGYVVEEYAVRFINSGRDVIRQAHSIEPRAAIIVANPAFDQEFDDKRYVIGVLSRRDLSGLKITKRSESTVGLLPNVKRLPQTAVEAKAILPSLNAYAGKSTALADDRKALEYLVKSYPRPIVASFATHGYFLSRQQAPSIVNPLLRCGLLLAGCNDLNSVVENDDGILTGLEIAGLDYRGTQLVVLSACETGLGDVENGEGVVGIRQAFQLAGAESVVATLWQVPDKDSAIIMNEFFITLAAGQPRTAALRDAQLKRIAARRKRHGAAHPFFWAAFTLTGQD